MILRLHFPRADGKRGAPHTAPRDSRAPEGRPTLQLNSDPIHPETAAGSTG